MKMILSVPMLADTHQENEFRFLAFQKALEENYNVMSHKHGDGRSQYQYRVERIKTEFAGGAYDLSARVYADVEKIEDERCAVRQVVGIMANI